MHLSQLTVDGAPVTPAPDFTAPNWTRCPSTHCERSKECRTPGACGGTGFAQLKRHNAELTAHVAHLLYAIDRSYFGNDRGLHDSAFVAPLRAYVKPNATLAELAA